MTRFLKLLIAASLIASSAHAEAPMCRAIFKAPEQTDYFNSITAYLRMGIGLARKNLDWLDSSNSVAARGKPFVPRMMEIGSRIPRKVLVTGIPLMPLPRENALERVFERVWEKPDYVLTEKDLKLINNERLLNNIEIMRTTSLKHPFLRGLSIFNGKFIFLSMIAAEALLVNNVSTLVEEGILNLAEFEKAPDFKMEPHQIRVINESRPAPRTAIQIGDVVYAYNEDGILGSQSLADFVNEPPKSWLHTGMEAVGLPNFARSFQVITLNLTAKDVAELGKFLERRKGGERSAKWVNDGMTRIAQLAGAHLPSGLLLPDFMIDSSAAFSNIYFSGLKRLGLRVDGRPLVAKVQHLSTGEGTDLKKSSHVVRNLWLNTVEANIVLRAALVNYAMRISLKIYQGDSAARDDVNRAVNNWKTSDLLSKLDDAKVVQEEIEYQSGIAAKGKDAKEAKDAFEAAVAEMKLTVLRASLKDITDPVQ